jgi:transcription termination factor Rho
MDEVIFEEFKARATGDRHDRKLERRIFPAIDLNKSGEEKDLLLTKEALTGYGCRKVLQP